MQPYSATHLPASLERTTEHASLLGVLSSGLALYAQVEQEIEQIAAPKPHLDDTYVNAGMLCAKATRVGALHMPRYMP